MMTAATCRTVKKYQFYRAVGLVASLIGTAMANFDMSFTVYAVPLKQAFNYTNTQVELIASVGIVGVGFGFVETFISKWISDIGTYVVITLLSSAGCFLISTVIHFKDDFVYNLLALTIIQFLINVSNNIMQLLILKTAVRNFSTKYLGTILGIYLSASVCGKLFYGFLYAEFFDNNLEGYFISIGIVWFVVFCLCAIFHKPIEASTDEIKELQLYSTLENSVDLENDGICVPERHGFDTIQDAMRSPFCQVLFWTSACFHACVITFLNNLTSVATSFMMEETMYLVYTIAVAICITRISFGMIYDKCSGNRVGFILLFFCYGAFLISMALSMFYVSPTTLEAIAVMVGIGVGAGNTVSLSMIVDFCGKQHYSYIHGGFYFFFTLFTFLLQMIFGFVYDAHTVDNSRDCVGSPCFQISFIVLSITVALIFICQILNMILLF